MGLALGLLAVMAGLLAASETAAQAVREGLALCGGSVIPALFPFLVVSRLFVATGSAAALGAAAGAPDPPDAGSLRSRRYGSAAGSAGRLSGGRPDGRESWPARGSLPTGGTAAAAVLQQLRPGLCLGRGGGGLLRQSPGRGMALADPCVGRHADGFADPQHLVPGGTDFAVCAADSEFRFSGGRPGSGGGDAPRLRLRGVLSGAAAGNGPVTGLSHPVLSGAVELTQGILAPAPYPPGLRMGGGPAGLGRPVGPRAVRPPCCPARTCPWGRTWRPRPPTPPCPCCWPGR